MRRRLEDLRGFDTQAAMRFATMRVWEAYRNGYDEIEFTHGAADVREQPQVAYLPLIQRRVAQAAQPLFEAEPAATMSAEAPLLFER